MTHNTREDVLNALWQTNADDALGMEQLGILEAFMQWIVEHIDASTVSAANIGSYAHIYLAGWSQAHAAK